MIDNGAAAYVTNEAPVVVGGGVTALRSADNAHLPESRFQAILILRSTSRDCARLTLPSNTKTRKYKKTKTDKMTKRSPRLEEGAP